MAEQMIIHNCSDGVKDQIRDYWQKKTKRLERLLQTFPPDQRHMYLTVRRHHGASFDAQAVLTLPTATLVAHVDPPRKTPLEAVDGVADRLAEEIRRHKTQLRHEEAFHHRR